MYDVFFAIKSIDIFFILVIAILLFFCLFLLSLIKKLKTKIFDLELENKNILERKVMKQQNVDLVSIQNISNEKVNSKSIKKKGENSSVNSRKSLEDISKSMNENGTSKKVEEAFSQNQSTKTNVVNVKNDDIGNREKITIRRQDNSFNKAYQKNVLQNKNSVTSSISLESSFDTKQIHFDLNDFVKKSEKVVPNIRKQSSTGDYLKELSDQIASELTSQTIELTDYEKEQEEHAVISYQELLSIKNQLNIVDDEEETIDFIEDLKNLRNRLN